MATACRKPKTALLTRQIQHRSGGQHPKKQNRIAESFGIAILFLIYKTLIAQGFSLLHLVNDGLESLRIVDSEVSENLAVDLDACLVESTHQLAVAHVRETSGSVDTLNPQSAEVALVTTVTISVGKTLLPSVLSYCPDILASSAVTFCELQNSCSLL